MQEEQAALNVRTFGSFEMSYKGRTLAGGRRRDTHFMNLMQVLLHNIKKGVSRDSLEDILLGDRDVENRHQALHTIIYKAKRKLKSMGLPEADYIVLKDGSYYWTSKIPVNEDAAAFEELYIQAMESEYETEKLALCFSASNLYKGEFLADYAGVIWASAEARRYRRMFRTCVEHAVSILRRRQDWAQMEKFGRYVVEVDPFSDWECLAMEALMENMQYEEAAKLYADTVEYYMKEQGISPSAKLMDMMEKLGKQMKHSWQVLDQIQKKLGEDPENIQGGYQCAYPIFQGIYQILCRMMERSGQSIYLMLCTLVDSKGRPVKDETHLEEMSGRLSDAIKRSVRHGDIINQYGRGQFLLLLVNTTRENCEVVEKRIDEKIQVAGRHIGVEYHVNSVICET
ncbi:MAG: hypothetical protein HFG41_12335 [Coprococcus sp.]|nr:hypothetical protein [Coprococcus sp.]